MTEHAAGPGMGTTTGAEPGPRTSVLAILSLVFAFLCFLPGLGLLGAIFGISAVMLISRAGGRLGGRGLAVAGIVLGFLSSAVWLGLTIGAMSMWGTFKSQFLTTATQVMTATEQGDWATARSKFAPSNNPVTDAEFERFSAEYHATVGAFQGFPDTFWDIAESYAKFDEIKRFSAKQNAIPLPARFNNGWALVVFEFDPALTPGGGGTMNFPIRNIKITAPDGKGVFLYDPAKRLPGGGAAAPGSSPTPGGGGT